MAQTMRRAGDCGGRSKRRAVGGGRLGQHLRTALHNRSVSLKNSFCELRTPRLVS